MKLSNSARVSYLLICRQRTHFKQIEVVFPYSCAQKYMQRATFAKAVKELEGVGLIAKVQVGGMYRKTNVYRIKGVSE